VIDQVHLVISISEKYSFGECYIADRFMNLEDGYCVFYDRWFAMISTRLNKSWWCKRLPFIYLFIFIYTSSYLEFSVFLKKLWYIGREYNSKFIKSWRHGDDFFIVWIFYFPESEMWFRIHVTSLGFSAFKRGCEATINLILILQKNSKNLAPTNPTAATLLHRQG